MNDEKIAMLEQGDIFFLYRPKVGREVVRAPDDVQRLYIVLKPKEEQKYRLIIIGKKQLPNIKNGGDRYWGLVAKVAEESQEIKDELGREVYRTKTRGEREVPDARPAGEGVYAIIRHEDHTHLIYELELPPQPGSVQGALHIEPEASYILSVKNPDAPSPPQADLPEQREADFPEELRQLFRNRKFVSVDPPSFLDYEGAELLLIGAREDPAQELGIRLNVERESEETAEVFTNLKLGKSERVLKPLFEGQWT